LDSDVSDVSDVSDAVFRRTPQRVLLETCSLKKHIGNRNDLWGLEWSRDPESDVSVPQYAYVA